MQSLHAGLTGLEVEFGPVTGRQKHCFLDSVEPGRSGQRPRNILPSKDDLLTNFDRCRGMVQSEYMQWHQGIGRDGANSVRILCELMTQFLVCVHHVCEIIH